MPPPGCPVFAGFLADHGPHNIANVPALLPSYIALAAVLTDRNNELNFRREENGERIWQLSHVMGGR